MPLYLSMPNKNQVCRYNHYLLIESAQLKTSQILHRQNMVHYKSVVLLQISLNIYPSCQNCLLGLKWKSADGLKQDICI